MTGNRGIKVVKTITVLREPEDVYQFWRDLSNLPKFMKHLKEVRMVDGKVSHWEAQAPAGMVVRWDAEIINEHENELIAWRSREGSEVPNAGSVRFKRSPSGRGTELTVSIEYIPPGGQLGHVIAKWFGEDPEHQIADDLRRLKSVLEAGEIPTTEGQPAGGRL